MINQREPHAIIKRLCPPQSASQYPCMMHLFGLGLLPLELTVRLSANTWVLLGPLGPLLLSRASAGWYLCQCSEQIISIRHLGEAPSAETEQEKVPRRSPHYLHSPFERAIDRAPG